MSSIIDFINKYKNSNPTGWRKWLIGSVVALLVVGMGVFFGVREYLRRTSLARLKHERDVLLERARQELVDKKLAVTQGAKETHTLAANAALARAAVIDQQIETLQNDHADNIAIINNINSWKDVDEHIK
jgi:flagellar biosynthesis/type III secretory pathway M-ring protein FliF/YscJ